MSNYISHDHEHDGIDRRGFLRCMAWAGTGLLWTVSGGVLGCRQVGAEPQKSAATPAEFSFVQISDSHIGFSREPNTDVAATLQEAVNRINTLSPAPAFVLHT